MTLGGAFAPPFSVLFWDGCGSDRFTASGLEATIECRRTAWLVLLGWGRIGVSIFSFDRGLGPTGLRECRLICFPLVWMQSQVKHALIQLSSQS